MKIALLLFGCVLGLVALAVVAGLGYDWLNDWRDSRDVDRVSAGEPFSLLPGRRALLGSVTLRLDPGQADPTRIAWRSTFESRVLALQDLPCAIGEPGLGMFWLTLIEAGPAPLPPARSMARGRAER